MKKSLFDYKPSTGDEGKGKSGKGTIKDVTPKGTIIVDKKTGKKYISEGKGNYRGVMGKPKQKIKKVKPDTNYKSTRSKKGKPKK